MVSAYGVEEQEMMEILKEACEQEINGTFKIENANTKEGSCIFTTMPKDNSTHYMCLDSSYTLKGNKCTRQEKIPAKVRFGCPKGYVLDGIYCQEK